MITCDLGSNTLRIAQFDDISCKRLRDFEKIVRTAKELHHAQCIGNEAISNILNALDEASKLFDFKHERTMCVTTQAMRMAKNASEVLAIIHQRFGLDFCIISGEEEANYTALAIEQALRRESLDTQTYVLFDLGGGSTELVFSLNGIKKSQSFPFGIVTTAERYKNSIDEESIHALIASIKPFITPFEPISKTYQKLIATAGTPTTVAAFLQGLDYEHYDAQKVNGTKLSYQDFDNALKELNAMPLAMAERYTGTNRRDLILVGILMVKKIMQQLGFEACIVFDDGLREGVAIAHFDAHKLL